MVKAPWYQFLTGQKAVAKWWLPSFLLEIAGRSNTSATVTLFNKFFGFFLHGGLKITCPHDFSYWGPCTYMILADPFMDFFQDVLGFVFFNTPQVGLWESPFVFFTVQHGEFGNLFSNFLASSGLGGNHPALRSDRIGLVQLVRLCIGKVWNTSILKDFYTFNFRTVKSIFSFDDTYLATWLASEFWSRGTWVKLTRSNSLINWFVNFRCFCILFSFASNSSLISPMTSFELLFSSMILASRAFATLNPVSMASYSASLLVMWNWSWTLYFKMSPLGVIMTTLAPPLFYTDDPSICIVRWIGSSWFSSCLGMVNIVMKSTSAWAFMAVRGLYSMLNWLSSMAYYIIHPTALGLFIAFLMVWFVITMIEFT